MLNIFSSPVILLITAIALCAGSFGIGYDSAQTKCNLQIKELQLKSEQIIQEQKDKQNEQEQSVLQGLSNVQSDLYSSNQDTTSRFNILNSTSLFDRNVDSVQYNSDSTSRDTNLSDNSDTTERVSSCNCKCPASDRARLQRLYERQLTLARDCEITANSYNSLIDFYLSLQATYNK